MYVYVDQNEDNKGAAVVRRYIPKQIAEMGVQIFSKESETCRNKQMKGFIKRQIFLIAS